jgi:hypothetical protein
MELQLLHQLVLLVLLQGVLLLLLLAELLSLALCNQLLLGGLLLLLVLSLLLLLLLLSSEAGSVLLLELVVNVVGYFGVSESSLWRSLQTLPVLDGVEHALVEGLRVVCLLRALQALGCTSS